MLLDTSALLAILLDEPERRRFSEAIERAGRCSLSAATFVEVSIMLESRHAAGLNFGGCFAYARARARARGEPLLYKGADFALTDLRPWAGVPAG